MKKYFATLKKCPLFYEISDENLISLLSCLGAKVASYRKKETILSDGDPAGDIGIVLNGSVQLHRMDYNGNRSILFGASESEMFAESFACAGIPAMPVDIAMPTGSYPLLTV